MGDDHEKKGEVNLRYVARAYLAKDVGADKGIVTGENWQERDRHGCG
jgi:hypothetical protein